jgi:hypothetical protein
MPANAATAATTTAPEDMTDQEWMNASTALPLDPERYARIQADREMTLAEALAPYPSATQLVQH